MSIPLIKKITILLSTLEKLDLIIDLQKATAFYDEPQIFSFSLLLRTIQNTRYITTNYQISASSLSSQSTALALIRCLGEAYERLSLFCFKKDTIVYEKTTNKSKHLMPLDKYTSRQKHDILGWIAGHDLLHNRDIFLPAQLVFLNYVKKSEPFLSTPMSTGAAGDFDRQKAILTGIYEIIERDAFISLFLTKSVAPKVKLDTIHNDDIQNLIEICHRYRLEVNLFEITNDIKVPSYLCVLVDRTGIGPAVTIGSKTHLNHFTAILGSLEESLMGRPWLKKELVENTLEILQLTPSDITTRFKRALYWSLPQRISEMNFLLNQKTIPFENSFPLYSQKEQLFSVKKIISEKGYSIFYTDVTSDTFKETGYHVVKVLIPGLQPLFLNERKKEYNMKRLKQISSYFNQKSFKINLTPHPML